MAQIFPRGANPLFRLILLGLPMAFGGTAAGLAAFYRSSYATGVYEVVPQPGGEPPAEVRGLQHDLDPRLRRQVEAGGPAELRQAPRRVGLEVGRRAGRQGPADEPARAGGEAEGHLRRPRRDHDDQLLDV